MEPLTHDSPKYCKGCDSTLPSHAFGKDRQRPDGLTFYCRACKVAHTAEWKHKNKEKVREQAIRARVRREDRHAV